MPSPRGPNGSTAPFLALSALSSVFMLGSATEGSPSLDRQGVIAHARERAPDVLRALEQVRAAEARLVGAERLTERNPSLQASAGPRFGEGLLPQVGISAWLPVPLLVDRARTMEVARTGLRTAEIEAEAMRLAAVGVALDLYVRVLYARERVTLARDRAGLAERLVVAASARLDAGDASLLEVELTRAEKAASLAAVLAAEAALLEATGDLALGLGLPALGPEDVAGALSEQVAAPAAHADGSIARALAARPDIRAGESALEGARAAVDRAALGWLPDLSVGANYGLEEGDHIGTLGVGVSLPLYDLGRAERAQAEAARTRVERELELRRRAARVEVARAFAIYEKNLEAARLLDVEALPRAVAAAELVAASYAAGKSDLAALLVVRRDALSVQTEHIARQLDAALAANRLAVVVGGATPIVKP